ncbi:MAG: hypothetical protein SWX82_19060 [Cyanobacteriota bacterium]|nr:hypothetical protein [Cyanobacteriota bacterium]
MMSVKRRQFLFLSSLNSISVAGICSKIVKSLNFFTSANALAFCDFQSEEFDF